MNEWEDDVVKNDEVLKRDIEEFMDFDDNFGV